MRVIGIDLGGTATRAVACDEAATVLGVGKAPGGNVRSSVGELSANLAAAVRACGVGDVDAVVVGAAGSGSARRAEVLASVREGLRAAGVSADPTLVTDLDVAFRSASETPDGVLLLAGTGAITARFEKWQIVQRCDGMGWLLGDEGSGVWLGWWALRAVAADLDKRGPRTALTGAICGRLDIQGDDVRQQLIRATDGMRPAQMAELVPLIFAAKDDPIACDLLDEAAERLVANVDHLRGSTRDMRVILSGGLLAEGPLRKRVGAAYPNAVYASRPVVGACALAVASRGGQLDRRALNANLDAL